MIDGERYCHKEYPGATCYIRASWELAEKLIPGESVFIDQSEITPDAEKVYAETQEMLANEDRAGLAKALADDERAVSPLMIQKQEIARYREERDAAWKQIRLAKRQRDRAIYKVHQLGAKGWHPDQEGPYREQ
jgi:hypothetical protein